MGTDVSGRALCRITKNRINSTNKSTRCDDTSAAFKPVIPIIRTMKELLFLSTTFVLCSTLLSLASETSRAGHLDISISRGTMISDLTDLSPKFSLYDLSSEKVELKPDQDHGINDESSFSLEQYDSIRATSLKNLIASLVADVLSLAL